MQIIAKKKYFLFVCALFFNNLTVDGQNRIIRNYYDIEKLQLKEVYKVLDTDTTILDGMYKTYYQNGKIKTIGFYTKGQATDYWEYFYQNGNVKMEGVINNFFNEGHWIFFYENGIKSMEGMMEKGKKNGFWRFYNEDGNKKSEGMIIEGRNDGEWKYYYEGGGVKGIGNYNNGIGKYTEYYLNGIIKMEGNIKMGKSDSTWNYYYNSGKIKASGIETQGLKEGKWQYFYENGNLANEGNYSKGQSNGIWKYYYEEDGKLNSQGEEIAGQKQGEWKMFYNDGKAKGSGDFKDGVGEYNEYYDNGNLKVNGNFKNGKHDGKWKYLYENGKVEGGCLYQDDEGWYTGYYPDGNIKMEGMLKDGIKSGVWKLYKQDGNIAGYYKTYYDTNLVQKSNTQAIISEAPTNQLTQNAIKKNKKNSFLKIKLYRPDPNIYKTFILSTDPLQLLLGAIPINLEYYVQDKWGIEVGFSYFRNPIFSNFASLPIKKIYSEGVGYSVRYKKYFFGQDFIGRPYIGSEYRYKQITHATNDTVSADIKSLYNIVENNHEFVFLIGDRFMKNYTKKGLTVDIYFGIGIGFKINKKNYMKDAAIDAIFSSVLLEGFYPPFRFGVSIGYSF